MIKYRTIEENREFLLKYMPNLDEFLSSDDINDFLDELDWVMQIYGYTDYPSDHPKFGITELGLKMQYIYDAVYNESFEYD